MDEGEPCDSRMIIIICYFYDHHGTKLTTRVLLWIDSSSTIEIVSTVCIATIMNKGDPSDEEKL
jgi:hypothetical protein